MRRYAVEQIVEIPVRQIMEEIAQVVQGDIVVDVMQDSPVPFIQEDGAKVNELVPQAWTFCEVLRTDR